ncbi:MAG: hypothetical protein AAB660_00270 [Patescibacteria group bacterium]
MKEQMKKSEFIKRILELAREYHKLVFESTASDWSFWESHPELATKHDGNPIREAISNFCEHGEGTTPTFYDLTVLEEAWEYYLDQTATVPA